MRRAGLTAAAVVAGLLTIAAPAGARPQQTDPPAPTPPATPVLASISPDLSGVEVDSVGFRRADTLYVFVRSELEDVRTTRATAETQLADLAAEELQLAASMQEGTVLKKAAVVDLAAVRERRRQVAVAGYVGASGAASAADLVDLDSNVAAQARGLIVRGLDEASATDLQAAEAAYITAVDRIERARSGRAGVRERVERITTIRDQAAAEEERLVAELAQRRVDLDQARALSTVVGADFTLVAMDAY